MLLMFGLPELLRKRKRPEEYEYPVIPEETNIPPASTSGQSGALPIIPPLPTISHHLFSQPAEPLLVDKEAASLGRNLDLRRAMAWHIVLSPPVSMQRSRQKAGRCGLR